MNADRRVVDVSDNGVRRSRVPVELHGSAIQQDTHIVGRIDGVRRQLAALSRSASDPEELRHVAALRGDLEDCLTNIVARLRNDPSLPAAWTDIGRVLFPDASTPKVGRVAAFKRYGYVGGIRRPGAQPGNWR